jgi:hypothetical protein
MRRNLQGLLWLGISMLAVLTLSSVLLAQASPDSKATTSVPTDWSHQHLIFSKPATPEQARRIEQNPRYWQQIARHSPAMLRGMPAILRGMETDDLLAPELPLYPDPSLFPKRRRSRGDWSQDLGSGATVGATNYPAKYQFRPETANCIGAPQPDFVVYPTGLAGSATQASIVAYDNLYAGCIFDGPVPTVYWAYNTSDGTITTSPVYSADGSQVAFVQTDTSGNGILVLLRWAASTTETVGNPQPLLRVDNASYPGCTTPCMTSTFLQDATSNNNADTNSSVFYDYSSDTAYVGDDAGWLHQITPFFNGIPTEVKSGGWPVQVNPSAPTALTSPVYDSTSGIVLVTDAGGFLYRIGPTTAFVATSGQLDFSTVEDGGPGIVEGPIVDSTSELVYVFAPADGSGNCVGGTDCTAVYQLPVDFFEGERGSKALVGASTKSGTPPSPLYLGAFDSTYENSVNATGNIYVCGNTGGDPILYQVPITASVFGTVNAGPVLSTNFGITPCSPVTDILNPNASGGATEWMFASAQTDGSSTACASGGCIFNFKDTPWQPSTAYTVGQEVLDNHFQIQVVSVPGTSGTTAPTWSTTVGGFTTGGSALKWVDQGVQSAFTPSAWTADFAYSVGALILDSNGDVERCSGSFGTSGSSAPVWSTIPGTSTLDFEVFWENLGTIATAAMPAAGGTSGIIVDNTVGAGTLPGASQVYFSTLSDQPCGSSGAGGCAVQASQSALQ